MRNLDYTARFRRDLKRELKGPYRSVLNTEFDDIILLLRQNGSLPARLRDHAMTGDLKDHRDLHVRPDLVLIYRLLDDESLQLVRLGSHSELDL